MRFNTATFVINLERRVDRRIETEQELSRVGWSAKLFPAIEPEDAGEFPSIGARGCFLSHLAVLRDARGAGVDRVIILEDDITFVPDFAERWQSAIDALESEPWSIFYPGHAPNNLARGLSLLPSSTAVRCTHFMVINRNAIPQLIRGLETILSRPPGHPLGSPMHVDGAYSTIRVQNQTLASYGYSPALGHQRPSRTDIGQLKWFDRIDALRPIVGFIRKRKLDRLQAKLGRTTSGTRGLSLF
jgi:glycosyl transferase family 25